MTPNAAKQREDGDMKIKSKRDSNFNLPLRDGEFPSESKHVVCVPNKLSRPQRLRYVPYLNVNDERGLIGTLDKEDLRRLKAWMNRVGI